MSQIYLLQVYEELGLERNTLGNSSEPFTWKVAPQEESTETEFSILPIVTGWDETHKAYMESKPGIAKDLVVLLSGSPPCTEKEGSHLLVRYIRFLNVSSESNCHDFKDRSKVALNCPYPVASLFREHPRPSAIREKY